MQKSIIYFIILSLVGLHFSCKSIKGIGDDFDELKDNLSSELAKFTEAYTPAEKVSREMVIGALDGIADSISQDNMDTLAATLTGIIDEYLNKTFENLKTDVPGKKFVDGFKDNLTSEETKAELSAMLSEVLVNATGDAKFAIDDLINSLASPKNKAKLGSLTSSLLPETLSDELASILNKTIAEINLAPLEDQIVNELLTKEFQNRIDTIVASAVTSANDAAAPTMNWLQKQATWLIGLIVGAAAIIILLVYYFRRKNTEKMSLVMMSQIKSLEGQENYEKLIKKIQEMAIANQIEPQLNKMLKNNGLLKEQNPT